jgi:hypothetical protein
MPAATALMRSASLSSDREEVERKTKDLGLEKMSEAAGAIARQVKPATSPA